MRISDWSSDVCSSDLPKGAGNDRTGLPPMTGREVQAYAAATVVGSPSDSVKSYFGMRKISTGIDPKTGKMALLLNNKPLFQNGTLDQGWWPESLLTPPSEEAAIGRTSCGERVGLYV